jgi:cobalt-zinc-cadmium resistance protein CzcA
MKISGVVILMLIASYGFSQETPFTIEEAIEQALRNNASIRAAEFETASQRQLKRTSFDLPKTEVNVTYGQYNSFVDNDNNISVSQAIPFTSFGSQASLNRSLLVASEMKQAMTENEIVYKVQQVYYELAFANASRALLQQQDTIYEGFFTAASARYETGETNLLEKTTAEAQRNEARNALTKIEARIVGLKVQLMILLNTNSLPHITLSNLTPLSLPAGLDTMAYTSNPSLAFMQQQIEVAQRQKRFQAAKSAPDFSVGFFSQTLIGTPESENGSLASASDRFTGFTIGISLPLWFTPHQARVRAAEFNKRAAESDFNYFQSTLRGEFQQAVQQLMMQRNSLEYYTTLALPNAELILNQSQVAFREGEIGYAENLLNLRNAIEIKEGYLQTLNDYNQSIIFIEFLSGNK